MFWILKICRQQKILFYRSVNSSKCSLHIFKNISIQVNNTSNILGGINSQLCMPIRSVRTQFDNVKNNSNKNEDGTKKDNFENQKEQKKKTFYIFTMIEYTCLLFLFIVNIYIAYLLAIMRLNKKIKKHLEFDIHKMDDNSIMIITLDDFIETYLPTGEVKKIILPIFKKKIHRYMAVKLNDSCVINDRVLKNNVIFVQLNGKYNNSNEIAKLIRGKENNMSISSFNCIPVINTGDELRRLFIQNITIIGFLYFIGIIITSQISQINNDRRDSIKKINFQNFNQRNVQFIQSSDVVPQLLNKKKQPIRITSAQASNIPGLSMLRGQNLPPGTIIQKRGQSIKVVLPKIEPSDITDRVQLQQKSLQRLSSRTNNNLPLSSRQLRGPFLNRERQQLPQNFKIQNTNLQQNKIHLPRQPIKNVQSSQQVTNLSSPKRQFLPIGPSRNEISLSNKKPNLLSTSNTLNINNHFIHTNGIQPPAPLTKEIEEKSHGSPPSEVPPNDFVVDELNKSNNFLETARKLALAHRLRIA
ncbi:Hypothetical protein SRAE_2000014300 [Strongyloides ratti]|uniref:Transmembrane protein n=1 Tax=Strongyloides ratti TaxID=34506 RepID=A0A090LBF6_STRRB|nr:Hypothetical protein SRAE_2000014300 [Strongyloides ratti]CEF65463.1 Hypothetical protein SRAE_2000014300 [Strongyloides ratti]